jgi:RNAse (barnase) inhibitor barstar
VKSIHIPFESFSSDKAFHAAFAEIMGFPAFYGHNWNAWIDCMSYIDDADAGM